MKKVAWNLSTFTRCSLAIVAQLALACLAFAQTKTPAAFPIEGRVFSRDGKPIAAARVIAYEADHFVANSGPFRLDGNYPPIASVATDAEGKFHISSNSNAQYAFVAVQAKGFGLCILTASLNGLDDPLTIELGPAARITARMVDLNDRPVAGVRVTPTRILGSMGQELFSLPKMLMQQLAQVTDASGMCTFPDMSKDASILIGLDDDRYVLSGSPAYIVASEPPRNSEPIHIEPGGTIEGRVTFADTSQPAAGVQVLCTPSLDSRTGARYQTVTDADGRYHFTRLHTSIVTLQAHPAFSIATHYAGAELKTRLDRGQNLIDQNLLLVPGTAVRGNVKSREGKPVPNVPISIAPTGFPPTPGSPVGVAIEAITTDDGTFEVHVMPGEYRVRAIANNELNLVAVENDTQPLTVEKDKPTSVDFAFERGMEPNVGSLKGTVVDEAGSPVEGAAVVCQVIGLEPHKTGPIMFIGGLPRPPVVAVLRAITDSQGKFEFTVIGPSANIMIRKGELAFSSNIKAGNPSPRFELKKVGGSFALKVGDAASQPIAGARVEVATSLAGGILAPRWGTTGADGTFVLSSVFGNRSYNFKITADGYATVEMITPYSGMIVTSPLQEGLTRDGQRLVMIEVGKRKEVPITLYKTDSFIAGMVVDSDGNPLADVNVWASGTRSGRKSGRSEADGRFRVENLVAGEEVSIETITRGTRSGRGRGPSIATGTSNVRIVHTPQPARSGRAGR